MSGLATDSGIWSSRKKFPLLLHQHQCISLRLLGWLRSSRALWEAGRTRTWSLAILQCGSWSRLPPLPVLTVGLWRTWWPWHRSPQAQSCAAPPGGSGGSSLGIPYRKGYGAPFLDCRGSGSSLRCKRRPLGHTGHFISPQKPIWTVKHFCSLQADSEHRLAEVKGWFFSGKRRFWSPVGGRGWFKKLYFLLDIKILIY